MTGTADVPLVLTAARSAGEVMTTELVTVSVDDSLAAAWELLSRGRFRHLPVVADGRCVGVVDDRMLAVEWLVGPLARPRRRIREILPERVHCVLAETSLRRVAQIMLEELVTAVPVVDSRMQLVGLVTDTDLVAELAVGESAG